MANIVSSYTYSRRKKIVNSSFPLGKHLLHFACLEPLYPLLEDDLPGLYPIGQVCVISKIHLVVYYQCCILIS